MPGRSAAGTINFDHWMGSTSVHRSVVARTDVRSSREQLWPCVAPGRRGMVVERGLLGRWAVAGRTPGPTEGVWNSRRPDHRRHKLVHGRGCRGAVCRRRTRSLHVTASCSLQPRSGIVGLTHCTVFSTKLLGGANDLYGHQPHLSGTCRHRRARGRSCISFWNGWGPEGCRFLSTGYAPVAL
jgi:hypothetical protein